MERMHTQEQHQTTTPFLDTLTCEQSTEQEKRGGEKKEFRSETKIGRHCVFLSLNNENMAFERIHCVLAVVKCLSNK